MKKGLVVMSNAKSMSTGGINTAIGPKLMQKSIPFALNVHDIIKTNELTYMDNLFSNVMDLLTNSSFTFDNSMVNSIMKYQEATIERKLFQISTAKYGGIV